MPVTAATGDIFHVAPQCAEAAILWLRGDFNMRAASWLRALQGGYGGRNLPDRPWRSPEDQLLELDPPVGQLRWLYVFANPTDAFGMRGLAGIRPAVERALSCLAERRVRRVAMIHIPGCELGDEPQDASTKSAVDMTNGASDLERREVDLDEDLAGPQPDTDEFGGGGRPSRTEDDAAARELIGAICRWQAQHPDRIDTVVLVDATGDFARFLG